MYYAIIKDVKNEIKTIRSDFNDKERILKVQDRFLDEWKEPLISNHNLFKEVFLISKAKKDIDKWYEKH